MSSAWPAQRVAQRVSWSGVQVAAVQVRLDSDSSESEPSDGEGDAKANVLQLLPVETLQAQFLHNANLRQQFASLGASFQAWRPIRGDGNCYYRAVLFAWLERCLALNLSFEALSRRLEEPSMAGRTEAQLCRRRLRAWQRARRKCGGDTEAVRRVLKRLTRDFNRKHVDYAFIYCLRQLVASYVRRHAKEPIAAELTFESWALALGARSIEEYCQQHICSMQKDAADHVQWVCPRVLQTVVRICMVDRDTASCKFIDYGQERRRAEMVVPTAAHLTSAASMSELRGAPEIFLLLKPGHYDILVPRDKAYRLLTPESSGLERQHFQAVLRCLEEKLVQSLKRSPIEDLGLFRAQLLSVLEPLQAVLKADDNASASPLPALEAFLRAAEPQSKPAPVPAPAPMVGGECCICLQPGATLTAACGCAYHGWCLQDYTKDGSELCHLHRSALGPELLTLAPKLPPTARLERPGSLGAALGKPCVICFGEEGVLKTLHCDFKAHVHCLKDFWVQKVATLCRLTDIRCPAEVAGCSSMLLEADLRDVVTAQDLAQARLRIREVEDGNARLIEELKRQSEEYRPTFRCAICLVDHEVEGCCTLPCQHRFCFESLQYHFDIIVRERRLSKLACPAEGCGYNLRSEDSIHIFQQVLPEDSYFKLLEFLTRDDPRIVDCRCLGCEERVFCDEGDDFADLGCPKGHRFCAQCDLGPHPRESCAQRAERRQQQEKSEVWNQVLSMGWKPCPRRCRYGGGYKAQEECDHVTCECGFEFCWDCGVDRRIPLAHDNRWHKPSCRYHTCYEEVAELPRPESACPACCAACAGVCCAFPADDGFPESYLR